MPFWIDFQQPNPPYDAKQISLFLERVKPLQSKWSIIRQLVNGLLTILGLVAISVLFMNWKKEVELHRLHQQAKVDQLYAEAMFYGLVVKKPDPQMDACLMSPFFWVGCVSPKLKEQQLEDAELNLHNTNSALSLR